MPKSNQLLRWDLNLGFQLTVQCYFYYPLQVLPLLPVPKHMNTKMHSAWSRKSLYPVLNFLRHPISLCQNTYLIKNNSRNNGPYPLPPLKKSPLYEAEMSGNVAKHFPSQDNLHNQLNSPKSQYPNHPSHDSNMTEMQASNEPQVRSVRGKKLFLSIPIMHKACPDQQQFQRKLVLNTAIFLLLSSGESLGQISNIFSRSTLNYSLVAQKELFHYLS